jgi:hypothetical protein
MNGETLRRLRVVHDACVTSPEQIPPSLALKLWRAVGEFLTDARDDAVAAVDGERVTYEVDLVVHLPDEPDSERGAILTRYVDAGTPEELAEGLQELCDIHRARVLDFAALPVMRGSRVRRLAGTGIDGLRERLSAAARGVPAIGPIEALADEIAGELHARGFTFARGRHVAWECDAVDGVFLSSVVIRKGQRSTVRTNRFHNLDAATHGALRRVARDIAHRTNLEASK